MTLSKVFDAMTSQPEPRRQHLKRDRICGDDKDCKMGLHDDSKRIFVFDHSNNLVEDLNPVISEAEYDEQSSSATYTSNEALWI